ncbi:MAG TPA: PASTA domain-containing protein [Flavisolibacter sp.]|jgi:beta-lactam-binding protein with PASTA domain|nr:PASTA domain-containing protein [Flavisolibacter sp.]
MFKILNNKPFWVHALLALALIFLLLFLFALSLNWITKHGESSTVPAVTGKNINDARSILGKKGFEVVVQDSVYYDSLPAGMILKQIPEADEVIKVNRTVYVTINRYIAPDVEMPNLNGYSYRNAEMVLKNLGLRIGDTTFRPDFAKNTILEASFNGRPIAPGTKIKMGSLINLVLGSGVGDEFIAVPDLVGMTYDEARALLDAQGIILGSVVPKADVRDTASAFIYQQRPASKTEDGKRLSIRAGQMMDIFLQTERPVTDSSTLQPPVINPENQ